MIIKVISALDDAITNKGTITTDDQCLFKEFFQGGGGGEGGEGNQIFFIKNWENVGHQARNRRVF